MESREWGLEDLSTSETEGILFVLTSKQENGFFARSRSGAVKVEQLPRCIIGRLDFCRPSLRFFTFVCFGEWFIIIISKFVFTETCFSVTRVWDKAFF